MTETPKGMLGIPTQNPQTSNAELNNWTKMASLAKNWENNHVKICRKLHTEIQLELMSLPKPKIKNRTDRSNIFEGVTLNEYF